MNVRDLVPWHRSDRDRNVIVRSESLSPVINLHREMNRLFDDIFRGFEGSRLWAGRGDWPSIDVEETDKDYRVTAELAGMEERDVEVLLQDGVLTIRGDKKVEGESRSQRFGERFYGRFERQLSFDHDVDENRVSATFRNGVLAVTVPKSAQAVERSKRIPINGVTGKSH